MLGPAAVEDKNDSRTRLDMVRERRRRRVCEKATY
jgi:hypothetical protein